MKTIELKPCLRRRVARAAAALHQGFAFIGLAAVPFLLTSGAVSISDPKSGSEIETVAADARAPSGLVPVRGDPMQQALTGYLSRRYRIAMEATETMVNAAFQAGQQFGLDPLLILAVMAVESRFNPIAQSDMGAKGLMQVIPKMHQEKLQEFGGEKAVLDPNTNILLGARILKEYIRRTGSVEAGLQFYNGALSDPSSQYAHRVFAEKERLREIARGARPLRDSA